MGRPAVAVPARPLATSGEPLSIGRRRAGADAGPPSGAIGPGSRSVGRGSIISVPARPLATSREPLSVRRRGTGADAGRPSAVARPPLVAGSGALPAPGLVVIAAGSAGLVGRRSVGGCAARAVGPAAGRPAPLAGGWAARPAEPAGLVSRRSVGSWVPRATSPTAGRPAPLSEAFRLGLPVGSPPGAVPPGSTTRRRPRTPGAPGGLPTVRAGLLAHRTVIPLVLAVKHRWGATSVAPHRGRMSGDVLLSHNLPVAVPSALRGLTSGFGMGPGISLSLRPP